MRTRSARGVVLSSAAAGLAVATAVAQQAPSSPEMNPPGSVMARGTDRAAATQPGGAADEPLTPSTPAVKAVQNLLAQAVTDVTGGGHAADLGALLARSDRDRVGTVGDWSDVDRASAEFQSAWQARFGASFGVKDKISIVFTEPLMHVAGLDVDTAPTTNPSAPAGSPHATVSLTGPGGHSKTVLRLAHTPGAEGAGGWKFDVPDAATAATLHDGLVQQITAVTANQARWPTDVDQAYVYVTQRLLSPFGEPGDLRR